MYNRFSSSRKSFNRIKIFWCFWDNSSKYFIILTNLHAVKSNIFFFLWYDVYNNDTMANIIFVTKLIIWTTLRYEGKGPDNKFVQSNLQHCKSVFNYSQIPWWFYNHLLKKEWYLIVAAVADCTILWQIWCLQK